MPLPYLDGLAGGQIGGVLLRSLGRNVLGAHLVLLLLLLGELLPLEKIDDYGNYGRGKFKN